MILSDFFTIEAIALAPAVFLNLILFITIILKKGKTKNIYYFLGFILTMFIWLLTTLLFSTINNEDYLLIITHLVYFGPAFIPMFMILFIKTFPNEKLNYSRIKLTLFLFFPILFSILAIIPNTVIDSVVVNDFSRIIIYGPFYIFYFLYIALYFVFVVYLMFEKYIILKGKERMQIEVIFLSLTIGSIFGLLYGLISPSIGKFTLFWAGSFYPGYLILATFYGILRYGLFDIKLVATQFITLSTWLLLLLKIIFATNNTDRVVDGIVLILIIFSGILIIKAVTKEIQLREKDDILVTDVTVLNKKLEKTNLQLKELDQKKSEFMALATHQLRAPLTAMKGYSSMILDGTFGKINNPEVEDAVDKILRSTRDLTMIVEDYLNISRIEQGRMQYNFSRLNLVDLLREIISGFEITAERKGLKIFLNRDSETSYFVKADEGKIKQVFLNIIDNAFKYTPTGSINIFINKNIDENKVTVKIEDTGVGMSKEVIPTLFHKYIRAPDASKINILGTGLGLYVAGEILKAHNARAWAESSGLNKGSRFFVELNLIT